MRISPLLAVAALATTVDPSAAQTALRRVQPEAFPLAVVPWGALGFNGTRALGEDAVTCPTLPTDCAQYGVGNGPMVGVDLQIPLPSTFGFQATGSAGRPSRVVCTRGAACRSTGGMTFLRGSAMVLFRFKARAPIMFGFGAAVSRIDPGPVEVSQDSLVVTEFGGAGVIAYDLAMSAKVGARVSWTHYLLKPSDSQLGGSIGAKSLTHDWVLAVGARIRIGS